METDEKKQRKIAEQNELDLGFYVAGWVCLALLVVYLLFTIISGIQILEYFPKCAFHQVTGLYCPGCGGTRASFAFLRGHFLKSFLLHPFVPYAGILGIYFMITQTIERIKKEPSKWTLHYRHYLLWIGLAIVILNFLVKNGCLLLLHIDLLG